MFGYMRLDKEKLSLQQRKIYRDYYCSCCLALKTNYGKAARFFLSYDIGYIALVLFPRTLKLEPCGKCGKHICDVKSCFNQEYWRKISLYEMVLVRMKLMDDTLDNRKKCSSLFLEKSFSFCFRKAERDVTPYLHYFKDYTEKEKRFTNYKEAEKEYLSFMKKIIKEIFDADEENIQLLLSLYRWILFIDAVDDYDKDIKKGTFSLMQLDLPMYNDKSAFVSAESDFLDSLFTKIHDDISVAYSHCVYNQQQKIILNNLVYDSIPKITRCILNGEKIIHEKLL